MKKTILSLMLIMGSFCAYGLDIHGDANSFTGNITSVTLTDEGGVINVVEGGGHMMMSTHSEEIEEVIENFLQTLTII